MTYNGFEVKNVSYPTPPPGWVDGAYRERVPAVSDACGLTFRCRHFREREETGWGSFDYHEGASFSFQSALGDREISASLRSLSGECSVSVYCDGVCVSSGITLSGDVTEVTLTVHTCDDMSSLCFSPDIKENDEAVMTLEIVSLSQKPLPPAPSAIKPTVFLASDSTVQTYDPYYYPQTGWGEVLYKYFYGADLVREYRPEGSTYSHCRVYELPELKIENRSIGGRSSRSFFLEGKLSELLDRAAPGDYIMIQFGHNDCTKSRPNRYASPDDYKLWLTRYIRAATARRITPVLVTPVMRRNCNGNGEFTLSFPEYAEKLRELACAFDVPLLDLGSASLEICRRLGAESSKRLYLWSEPDKYDGAYANGVSDNTHLSRTGALIYAGEIARLLAESNDKRLTPLGALVDMRRRGVIKEALCVN